MSKDNLNKHEREVAENERQLRIAKRVLAIKHARDKLIPFAKLIMPHPDDPDNSDMSMYRDALHHRVMAAALEEVEKGTIPRLIVTLPPRHGKSQLVCKTFIPWYLARDPYRSVIFATYNDDFAEDFGADIRSTIEHPSFSQVFPYFKLKKGGKAKDRLQTEERGLAVFRGRGGSLTGRGADLLVIDDLLKDAEEANSPTIREKCWEWFTKVAMTRLMSGQARVVIVMTRWHEDDVVGRLTDPSNPHYRESEAKKWKVINLPAIADVGDPMGRAPGEALWPERFPLEFLEAQRTLDSRGFSALYQQKPTPEDGEYFRREYIKYYDTKKINWKDMRVYAASDHAVGKSKVKNDQSVLLIVAVDEFDTIYLIDCWHGRDTPEVVIERMLDFMKAYSPIMWWAEKGHITQSIGPFLRKRQMERNIYTTVEEVTPSQNKEQRAQSIRARMAMGKVLFPRHRQWALEMIEELMKFPNGKHDDFTDTLAYIGLKLGAQHGPSAESPEIDNTPKIGSMAWIKMDSNYRRTLGQRKSGGEMT